MRANALLRRRERSEVKTCALWGEPPYLRGGCCILHRRSEPDGLVAHKGKQCYDSTSVGAGCWNNGLRLRFYNPTAVDPQERHTGTSLESVAYCALVGGRARSAICHPSHVSGSCAYTTTRGKTIRLLITEISELEDEEAA
jgi:hypothetical protein